MGDHTSLPFLRLLLMLKGNTAEVGVKLKTQAREIISAFQERLISSYDFVLASYH